MRNYLVVALALTLAFGAYLVYAGPTNGKMDLKVGDQLYACGCGTKCPCQTMSNRPATCHCGMDLAKAEVVAVGEGTADLRIGEKTLTFKTVGKYTCGCEGDCCQTISQSPGKCGCGKDLVEVAAK